MRHRRCNYRATFNVSSEQCTYAIKTVKWFKYEHTNHHRLALNHPNRDLQSTTPARTTIGLHLSAAMLLTTCFDEEVN